MMNGADEVLYSRGQSHAENLGDNSLGFFNQQPFRSINLWWYAKWGLHVIERIGWWGHIIMVFGF